MLNKKLVALLSILFAFVMIMAGCGDKTDGDASASEPDNNGDTGNKYLLDEPYEFGEEPLELTMFGNYDWYTMPGWGDDVASAWMKEEKNIDIKAIDGGGNAAQRLSTLIAGKDLPDFIWTDKGTDVQRLIDADMLVPFDDYLDRYPNLKEWLSEDAMNMLRADDGKLYQFPNWYNSQPFGNAGYVINKEIYEELGSPTLETPEDLYQFLKQVKEKFPDVTPYETNVDAQGASVLYSAFAEGHSPADIRIHAVPKDGELVSIFNDEAYIESLKFASKLFREGLMTNDAFTQDEDSVREKVTTGRVAVFAAASPIEFATVGHYTLQEEDPDAGYFMIDPIAKEGLDRDEIYPGSYEMLGWNVAVIPKNEEDPTMPEKTFAFLDWLTGPVGESVQNFGVEGEYWDGFDDEGWPQFTEKYVSNPEGVGKIVEESSNHQWVGNSNFLDTGKAKFTETLPVEDRPWDTHWQWEVTWDSQKDQTDYYDITPMPETPEGETLQLINDLAEESRAQAVYAESDEEVEKIMQEAQADAEAVGFSELLDYMNKEWQENLDTLGW